MNVTDVIFCFLTKRFFDNPYKIHFLMEVIYVFND